MARVLVGVAWPYANGPFHIGHLAGAYLPADAFARYHRLRGDAVLMVSGSDMHGTPILVAAENQGTTPERIARTYHEVNRGAFARLGFTFDCFTETHTLVHERTVQELFLRLLEKGFVDRRTEENPYCPKHERFLPDRYLVGTCPHCGFEKARGDECEHCGRALETRQLGSPRCSLCGTPAEFRPSEHFYLKLDRLAPELERFQTERPHWRPNVSKAAANFRKEGLHATPITRDLTWGVPIPLEGYDGKRFYVWFDAVIGYLSASKEWAIRSGNPAAWEPFWDPKGPVRAYYFVGKDNIFHHTTLWPGILLGAGELALPYDVPANEWLVVEGKKLAKSHDGRADVSIPSLLEHFPPDQIRFYAALLAPQNHDTEFDWEEFERLHDEILANQYGNLVQRLLVLVRDREGGRIPAPPPRALEDPEGIGKRIRSAHERITGEFESVHLKEALELALTEIREGNRRFHDAQPWKATDEERRRALFDGIWLVHAASVWLSPFLPFSSAQVWKMLGHTALLESAGWEAALSPPPAGQSIGEPRPIFPKPERTGARHPPKAARPGSPPEPKADPRVPLLIRAAVISDVAAHPTADRLYVLTLDVGEERPRTVVAGIRPQYAPEQLKGARIALLANLEPRRIRSIESRGMLLAAEGPNRPVPLLPPSGVPPGTLVSGADPNAPTISHDAFSRVELLLGRVAGPLGTEASQIDIGARKVRVPGRWETESLVVVRTEGPDSDRGEVLGFGPSLPLSAPDEVPIGARVR